VLGVLSFNELLSGNFVIPTKPRKEASLSTDAFVEEFKRVLVGQLKGVHVWFSPAIGTGKIALIDNRRHLHARMAFDTVEGPLIASTIPKQRFLCPVAGFDTTMFSNNVISLFLQFCFECGVHTDGKSS
jgi:hypothetical protein